MTIQQMQPSSDTQPTRWLWGLQIAAAAVAGFIILSAVLSAVALAVGLAFGIIAMWW